MRAAATKAAKTSYKRGIQTGESKVERGKINKFFIRLRERPRTLFKIIRRAFFAVLAQWQQHRFCKAAEKSYVGSSPTHGSIFNHLYIINSGCLSIDMKCLSECCNNEVKYRYGRYCSNKCQMDHKWQKQRIIVEQDKLADLNLGVERTGSIAKRFLIEKNGPKCFNCNWSEVNVHTGKVPIELDHKDGNCSNNKLDNLRLLCPNCHSLTSTYKGSNKGKNKTSERYNNWKRRFKQ